MKNSTHWTETSTTSFVHSLTANFLIQLEKRMEAFDFSRRKLAHKLGITESALSLVLDGQHTPDLRKLVRYARALGMKATVVLYDDDDPDNWNGPINPDVFKRCWEKQGKPRDFFDLGEAS